MKNLSNFKKWVLLGGMIGCFMGAPAQNLVPNGSFEEGITCPSFIGNVTEECASWYGSLINNEGSNPTPDWFHECSESDLLAPPDIAFGYQIPQDGEGYVGVATYLSNDINYRELVGVELSEPLSIGQTYLVEFFVSDVLDSNNSILTNNVGFNFSTHPFYFIENFPINVSHFSIDTIIPISEEWTQVTSSFIADSNYTHFHLGNFYDDENTDTVLMGGIAGYYLFDNVSINQTLSNDRLSDSPNVTLSIFPNPVKDRLIIISNDRSRIKYVRIMNSNGQLIQTHSFLHENTPYEIGVSHLPNGFYSIIVETSKSKYYEKFVKH